MAFKKVNAGAIFVRTVGEYRCANYPEQSAVHCRETVAIRSLTIELSTKRRAKFGRDLPGPVRALEHQDSRVDQAVLGLEAALVPKGCEILEKSKRDAFA